MGKDDILIISGVAGIAYTVLALSVHKAFWIPASIAFTVHGVRHAQLASRTDTSESTP